MSLFERAWLYITRKRGKTLIMFCILFAMASGILSGISIKKDAQAAMQQARESVGGSFSMNLNYDESNPNVNVRRPAMHSAPVYGWRIQDRR